MFYFVSVDKSPAEFGVGVRKFGLGNAEVYTLPNSWIARSKFWSYPRFSDTIYDCKRDFDQPPD